MEKIGKLFDFLKGKKTIITGALLIVLGLLQGSAEMVLEGFGLISLRLGLKK